MFEDCREPMAHEQDEYADIDEPMFTWSQWELFYGKI